VQVALLRFSLILGAPARIHCIMLTSSVENFAWHFISFRGGI